MTPVSQPIQGVSPEEGEGGANPTDIMWTGHMTQISQVDDVPQKSSKLTNQEQTQQ